MKTPRPIPALTVADMAESLRRQGLRVWSLGTSSHTLLVIDKARHLLVWDNGGGIGVSVPNTDTPERFVPTAYFGRPVGALTMVYRLLAAMRGEEIDYALDLDTPTSKE